MYGGPTMSVSKLSEQMLGAGCEIEVFTTTANGNTELPVVPNKKTAVDGVPVTYFKRITKDHSHLSPSLLRSLWLNVRKYDVVHIHAWWNLVSVLSCLVTVMRKVPVVVSPRGTLSAYSFTNRNNLPKKLLHQLLGKYLLRRSYIHVTSVREKAGIEGIIQPKQIINIPNFVVLGNTVFKAEKPVTGCLELLFFSRVEEKKGLDILFNALRSVSIPYHLTIAGDGDPEYIERLKALSVQNEISGNVNWIGFQGANKFDLLQQYDVMVLPSHDENFGNVVIESLSVGTAVLISENVGLADYVAENKLGWVCTLDEDNISGFIIRIGGEKARLSEIRKQAPGKIRKDFSEETLVKEYMDMYNQIIKNG